jgi:predicted DNA binding CopG/RHH family protein
MKSTNKKSTTKFHNEDEEREFWAEHSPLDYFNLTEAKKASFPNLKPSLKTISLRLPVSILERLKALANKWDIPYQSLLKFLLARSLQEKGLTRRLSQRAKARGSA